MCTAHLLTISCSIPSIPCSSGVCSTPPSPPPPDAESRRQSPGADPPGVRHPLDADHQIQTPLDADTPGCRPPLDADPWSCDLWCMLGPPPVNRMTDTCENITLPQTSFAGGKYNVPLNVIQPLAPEMLWCWNFPQWEETDGVLQEHHSWAEAMSCTANTANS